MPLWVGQEVQEVPRARVAAPWAGVAAPFLACGRGEGSRVLLRSALRSTASPQTALRRTLDPSPLSVFSGAEHHSPGLGGALAGRWERAPAPPTLRGFSAQPGMTYPPKPILSGTWADGGNDLSAEAQAERDMGGWREMTLPPKPRLRGPCTVGGQKLLAPPTCPGARFLRAPPHADVKRGSRSRGGQSAAAGGRAKR